jgi:hypothetical protein
MIIIPLPGSNGVKNLQGQGSWVEGLGCLQRIVILSINVSMAVHFNRDE